MIGFTDRDMPELPAELRQLLDVVSPCFQPTCSPRGSIFVDSSPMTHDPILALRVADHAATLRACIVYDFIPFDWPGYLPDIASRIDYVSRLRRLRDADLFLPISEYSARRLSEILGIPDDSICVTGACVRRSLYLRSRTKVDPYLGDGDRPYFLAVGGGDRRKNMRTAIEAIGFLQGVNEIPVSLKIVGRYEGDEQRQMKALAKQHGCERAVNLLSDIDDQALGKLYEKAVATIVPSHIEGFSLPVVESAVFRTPVVASTCPAHCELIDQPEALFPSNDPKTLADRLRVLLRKPTLRTSLSKAQSHLPAKFHEEAVAQRFWNPIVDRFQQSVRSTRSFGFNKGRKPTVAFLSPFPPDPSGVATYTQETLKAAPAHFNVDLYTDAPRPLHGSDGFLDAGPITLKPLVSGRYDAVVSVLGNSDLHTSIFELFERHGGPCILHDSRLVQIYHHRLGRQRFLELAVRFLQRPVKEAEVDMWLQDRETPSLFVELIIERADPLIVHTPQLRDLLQSRYKVRDELAQFSSLVSFTRAELSAPAQSAIRKELGIPPDVFAVSSFGYVDIERKASGAAVAALDLLRSWDIPAELYFVGSPGPERDRLIQIARDFGVERHVHLQQGFVTPQCFRNFLIASDAAIQLRAYRLGQASAALMDCAVAGLPVVATDELATCLEAPSYVHRIPNHVSPLLVAEQLAVFHQCGYDRSKTEVERQEFYRLHSFETYVRRLHQILKF